MVKDKLKRLEKKLPDDTEIKVFIIDDIEGTFIYDDVEYPIERYNEFTTSEDKKIEVINAEFV